MSGLNSSLTCNYDVYGRLSRTSLSDASGYDVIYDDRGEVAAATVAGHSESHTYDFIGNEFDSNCLNQPEYASSGVSVWYDANGRAIVHYVDAAMPALYLTYDTMHRIVSANLLAEPNTLVQSNVYDNVGRRVMKYAPDGVHRYYYDDWLLRLELVEHDGVTDSVEYVWGKDISGSIGGAAGIGGLLYAKINGVIYVPQYDAYGNIIGYCDSAGAVVASYAYDAFGRTISQSGALADVFAFRYSTKYFDRETGFYYYGKRYYSPALRRWLTRDPIGESGGVNLYVFCDNHGVVNFDIYGLTSVSDTSYFPGAIDLGTVYSTQEFTDEDGLLYPAIHLRYWHREIDDGRSYAVRLKRERKSEFEDKVMLTVKALCLMKQRGEEKSWFSALTFDTGYFQNMYDYFLIEGESEIWAGNEINYFGVGMLAAAAGRKASGWISVYLWKMKYLQLPSRGTKYWYDFGLKNFRRYYNTLNPCTCEKK